MTFGYDANVVRLWNTASANGLYDHGKSLEYHLDHVRSKSPRRPILFVAHSLGGLVCEQALLLSDATRRVDSITNNTIGVLFMGTPHYGSSLASWGSILAKFSRTFRATNTEIVGTVERGSADLQRVGEEFQRMLHRQDIVIDIVCVYEELPMPILGKIVESESAILRGYRSCSIHADHRNMTKFSGTADAGYEQARATLKRWIDTQQESEVHGRVDEEQPGPADQVEDQRSATAPIFHNNGSVSGRSVLQNLQLNGDTNTLNFN
jgi:protein SERAC1